MSIDKNQEILELQKLLFDTWVLVDPATAVARNEAGYSDTFLELARAVSQAGFHRETAVKEDRLQGGDRFKNTDGGWGGTILIVEGNMATVRYDGEDPRNTTQVPLDTIKPDVYGS